MQEELTVRVEHPELPAIRWNEAEVQQNLTEMLAAKGYPIARRTVAKYRQQLNIPVARLRK